MTNSLLSLARKTWIALGGGKNRPYPAIPSPYRRSGILFVHIPKAAGSTLTLNLFGTRLGHRTLESFWKADPEFTENAFKFAFVRHPYLRFVSAYRYLSRGGISTHDAAYLEQFPREFRSLRTLAEACEAPAFRNAVIHLAPQAGYLSLPARARHKIHMDFVGKTEFFNDHIDLLATLVPADIAPRLLLCKHARYNVHPSSLPGIDPDVFHKIRTLYQDDFEFFGYDEWGTPEKLHSLLQGLQSKSPKP